MLSQLLSSKPKTKLINLFLAHPGRSFSQTELRVNSGCAGKLLKQTLKDLEKMDFLIITGKNKVRYYQMNKHFPLYPELVSLLRKVKNIPTDDLARAAAKIGSCRLVALTGVFSGHPRIETDVLFVKVTVVAKQTETPAKSKNKDTNKVFAVIELGRYIFFILILF